MQIRIDNPDNRDRLAIVVVGYNRQKALARLLSSLSRAIYPEMSIPLVISIDASGDLDLYKYVNGFEWPYGDKYVNIEKERLGLKKHIFQCFSLTKFFKGIVLLEDDLFVSPFFYHYSLEALDYYKDDEAVSGIALYKNEYNGFYGLPMQFIESGFDVFAWQSVCSWGELINERMWNSFSKWLDSFEEDFESLDMNRTIKGWKRAWSKYMYAYMLQTDTYFIYPYQSLTTNFNDAGGEHGGGGSIVQVSLLQGSRNYCFGRVPDLQRYDVYGYNKDIPLWIGLSPDDITVDYYGGRDYHNGRFLLSPERLPYKQIRGYQLTMRPWELNLKYDLEGDDISLYELPENAEGGHHDYTYNFLMYYFRRYENYFSIRWVVSFYWSRLKSIVKRTLTVTKK